MKNILEILKDIEKEYNIKIIYACDTGSRASVYNTENSDYDIRFIFIQDIKKYLALTSPKEVIERKINKDGQEYDIVGFDIKKALSHIAKSNMQIWTWLYSPSVYITSDTINEIKEIMPYYENKKKILFQYKSWFISYLDRAKNEVKVKYYLNILIRLHECLSYIDDTFTFQTVDNINYAKNIQKIFLELLNKRDKGIETTERIVELDKFINEQINYLSDKANMINVKTVDYSKIDNLFYSVITKS